MRLPEFITQISPIRETITAIQAGEQELEEKIEAENGRLSVASADWEGLSLWEADYGLEFGAGLDQDVRRAKIRTAMSGACTLTPKYLQELCVTIGGADFGEVEELFPDWTVQVKAVTENRVDTDLATLKDCIETLLPAHLKLDLQPCGQLSAQAQAFTVLSSGEMRELWGELEIKEGHGTAEEQYFSAVTGAVILEFWCAI